MVYSHFCILPWKLLALLRNKHLRNSETSWKTQGLCRVTSMYPWPLQAVPALPLKAFQQCNSCSCHFGCDPKQKRFLGEGSEMLRLGDSHLFPHVKQVVPHHGICSSSGDVAVNVEKDLKRLSRRKHSMQHAEATYCGARWVFCWGSYCSTTKQPYLGQNYIVFSLPWVFTMSDWARL